MKSSSSCFTIQHNSGYHCFIRRPRDNYEELLQLFQSPRHQQAVQSLHLVIHNGQDNLKQQSLFLQFLQLASHLPHLHEFTISIHHTRRLSASAVTLLLRGATSLQSLTLQDVNLEDSPYELAEVLQSHPSLQRVVLERCYCRPVHVLIKALSHMPRLHELILDGTLVSQQKDHDAMACLKSLVQDSPSLTKLAIHNIAEVGMTPQLLVLVEALSETTKSTTTTTTTTIGLQELSLLVQPHDSLPMAVIQAVARMLTANTTLQILTITWMGGGEILLPIIEALASNTSLQQFRLAPGFYSCAMAQKTRFSKPFLQRATHILQQNMTLSHLWFDSWEDHCMELDLYLRANQLGRRHLLQDSNHCIPSQRPTQEEWKTALFASHNHVHVSYYWLSHNPTVLC